MRNKNILLVMLVALSLLTGCFEDKGNYVYKKIESPTWLFNIDDLHISVSARSGSLAEFTASNQFLWDNENRKNEVRYEWTLNDVLLSTDLDFKMETDKIMQMAGINEFPESGIFGKFMIIEKESGITYMARVYITFSPRYAQGDWLVVSEDGQNTKCSAVLSKKRTEGNNTISYFESEGNSFKMVNNKDIPGKPIGFHIAKARNIGPLGSISIMTDKVSYEVDAGTMELVRELKDDFPDGVPADFNVIDRDDIDGKAEQGEGSYTFLATEKGEIFTRQMSANYLGGSFLSEPYIIDSKGYKITKFGHHIYAAPNIPCYDEKNNRVVMANRWRTDIMGPGGMGDQVSVYKCRLVPVKPNQSETQKGIPVWNMPEGTKVLYLGQHSHGGFYISNTNTGYVMIYNTADGKTMIGDFVVEGGSLTVSVHYPGSNFWREFPEDRLDENTIFLSTAATSNSNNRNSRFRTYYTKDNILKYMDRPVSEMYDFSKLTVGVALTLESKITFLTYNWNDNNTLVVGCENGDLFFYNSKNLNNLILINKVNLGGKIVSAKRLGAFSPIKDYF